MFSCPEDGCTMTFGYKHVMQRHLERHHRPVPSSLPAPPERAPDKREDTSTMGNVIALLTGQDYHEPLVTSKAKAKAAHRPRVIACPWPNAFGGTRFSSGSDNPTVNHPSKCAFMFSRAYDLRRHLRSAHGLEVGAHEVGAWVSERKR